MARGRQLIWGIKSCIDIECKEVSRSAYYKILPFHVFTRITSVSNVSHGATRVSPPTSSLMLIDSMFFFLSFLVSLLFFHRTVSPYHITVIPRAYCPMSFRHRLRPPHSRLYLTKMCLKALCTFSFKSRTRLSAFLDSLSTTSI